MRTIQQWFDEYGQSHQHETNKFIHWICVPLIFFSIVGMLASIPSGALKAPFPPQLQPYVHFGTVVVALVLLFYLRLSFSMFLGMVLAWAGQFYGHKLEGKKPSFLKDLQFLLIGPAWLLGFIYRKLGIPY